MKFQLLPIGARFEFEGKVHVKTGPLTAASEESGQRLIPRSAVLKPLDGTVIEVPRPSELKLDETKVTAALDALHAECARLLRVVADDASQAQTALTELDAARLRFLAALV
ncbi:MAG: hypothetical protein PHD37_06760 [Gallionellaceae bacterium]|nr:hypothetical protein [Gallionellaceae bacterium]